MYKLITKLNRISIIRLDASLIENLFYSDIIPSRNITQSFNQSVQVRDFRIYMGRNSDAVNILQRNGSSVDFILSHQLASQLSGT